MITAGRRIKPPQHFGGISIQVRIRQRKKETQEKNRKKKKRKIGAEVWGFEPAPSAAGEL